MSVSVRLSHVASYIAECQKTDGFSKEFSALLAFDNSLKRDQITNFPTALKYLKKNRWTDGGFEVYPNENSRIKLPTSDSFQYDYINANLIPKSITGSSCDYIATQAPMIDWVDGNTVKEDTMHDFWNMIWLNNVPVIVMLAKLIEEEEKIKAHQYWPDINTERVYSCRNGGNIIVTGVREYLYNNDSEIIIREMSISYGNSKRIIHQVHFMGWPDNSIPTKHDGFVNVLLAANELMKDKITGPMTVHCSAGVGRTGTYILIHTLFHKLVEHIESETTEPFELNIFDTVLALKHLRWQLVYNVAQYEFCYHGTLFIANKYLGRGSCAITCNDNY